MIGILLSPIGRFAAGLAVFVLAAGFSYGAGFWRGDGYRAKIDGAAEARARIELLNKEIAAANAAASEDAAQAASENAALAAQLEQANAAVKATTSGVCLDGPDVGRLRSIWNGTPKRKH
jgi:hypothetical protein